MSTMTVSSATVYPYYMNNTDYYLYFEYDNLKPPSGIPSTQTWTSSNVSSSIKNNSNGAIYSTSIIGHGHSSSSNTFRFKLGIVTSGNIGSGSNTYIQVTYKVTSIFTGFNYTYTFYIDVPIIYGTYAAPTITNISPSTSSDNPYSINFGDTVDISFTITQDEAYNNTNVYNSTQSQEYTGTTVKTLLNQYSGTTSSTSISPPTGTQLANMSLGWESTNSNQANYSITFGNATAINVSYLGWNVSTSLTPINFNYNGISNQGVSSTAFFYYKVIDPTPTCNSYSNSIYPNRISSFDLPASSEAEGVTYNWQIYNIVGGGTYDPSSGSQSFYNNNQPSITFTTPIRSTITNTANYDVSNSDSGAGSNNIEFTIVEYSQPSISVTNTTYYLYTGQTIDISVSVVVDINIPYAGTINSINYKQVELSGNIYTQGSYGALSVNSLPQTVISVPTVNVPDAQYTAYQSQNTDSVSFFYIDTFNQSVTANTGYTAYETLIMNIINGSPFVSNNTIFSSPNRDVSFNISTSVSSLNGTYPDYITFSFNPNTIISPQTFEASYNEASQNYLGKFSYILPTSYYSTLNSYDISYIVTNPDGNSDNSANISFNITPYSTPTYSSSLPTYTVLAGETLSIPFQLNMSQEIIYAGSNNGTNYNQVELSGTIITNPTLGSVALDTQTYYPFTSNTITYDISYIAGLTLGSDSFTFNIQDTFNKDVTDSSGNTGNITLNINIKNPTEVSKMSLDCSENIGTNNANSQVYIDLSANDEITFYPLNMYIKNIPLNGKLYYKSSSDPSYSVVTQGYTYIGQMTAPNTYNYELYYQGSLYYYGSDQFIWYVVDNQNFSSSTATNIISIEYVNVPPTAISYNTSLVSYYGITDISTGTPVDLSYSAVNRSLSDLSFTLQSFSPDISYATLTKELITYVPYTLPEVNLSDTGGYEKNNVGVIDNTLVNLDNDYGFSFNIQDPSGAISNTGTVGVYIIPYLEDIGVEIIKNGSGNIYLNTEYSYLKNNDSADGYLFSYYIMSDVSNGKLTYNGNLITVSTSPFVNTNISDNTGSQLGLPILYTPNTNYTGNDSFTWYISYTNINDGYTATSNSANVTINIPIADNPPVAENKTYTIKLK